MLIPRWTLIEVTRKSCNHCNEQILSDIRAIIYPRVPVILKVNRIKIYSNHGLKRQTNKFDSGTIKQMREIS